MSLNLCNLFILSCHIGEPIFNSLLSLLAEDDNDGSRRLTRYGEDCGATLYGGTCNMAKLMQAYSRYEFRNVLTQLLLKLYSYNNIH